MILTKDKRFYKSLIALAIPMIVQNLITYSVGLADNIMIGNLGDTAVSGVYLGNQLQVVLQVAYAGIEATILLISAQYWGKGDVGAIRRIVSIALRFSLGLGAALGTVCAIIPKSVLRIFTSDETVIEKGAEYLSILCFSFVFFCLTQSLIAAMRSVESANIGMLVSLASLVIDVALNYVLIFGKLGLPALGVRGAAIATLIARVCESAIILIYVRFIDKKLKFRLADMKILDRELLRDMLRYGAPLVAGQFVWGANLAAQSIILGHFTEAVITGTSLANTLNNLMYVAMNGVSGAVGIIIGKTVGSGDLRRIKEYARTVQLLLLSLGVTTSFVFLALREPFISLYNITPESADYARQFINILRVTCIGSCYQAGSLFGIVKSGGDVSFVFKNDTIHIFGIVIPSAIVASALGAEPWIVFACLKADQILKCFVAVVKIQRYNWMKNLTRGGDGASPQSIAAKEEL